MLHQAAFKGLENSVNAAIAKGADPDVLCNRNLPAIRYAVGKGHEEIAMALLKVTDPRLLSNKYSSDGATMLHLAAERAMGDFIKAAVARGADPDVLDKHNVPAVWYAALHRHEAVAILLMEVTDSKLLSNVRDSGFYFSTLYRAAEIGMWGFIKAAVAKGIDPYAKNSYGRSLIDIIKKSSLGHEEKRALVNDVMHEHAWAKRGALVMLRRRFRQAWEAECDAREVAAAAAQAPSAAPDA
jgi:ankyrin repeat protein